MSDPAGDAAPAERLPDSLIETVDALEADELQALVAYTEQRIESLPTPLAEEIRADASGELLGIEAHDIYALVRMRPQGPESETEPVGLYHVSRERGIDGEESLHWAYLGDVREGERTRCVDCGRSLDPSVDACPHCGSEEIERTEDH